MITKTGGIVLIETQWNVKSEAPVVKQIFEWSINRNIVECKDTKQSFAKQLSIVLIETQWNVKRYIEQNKDGEQKY